MLSYIQKGGWEIWYNPEMELTLLEITKRTPVTFFQRDWAELLCYQNGDCKYLVYADSLFSLYTERYT
jgi:hypothetical protein